MATETLPAAAPAPRDHSHELALQWRQLTRIATIVALFTSPAVYAWLRIEAGWSTWLSLLCAAIAVLMFRGLLEVIFRRFIPWPTLFGADAQLREEDITARRRAWYWRTKYFRLTVYATIAALFYLFIVVFKALFPGQGSTIEQTFIQQIPQMLVFPLYFLGNFAIFFGPFLLMAVSQISHYEPGDADWGVKLDDVRGQAEAKEEVSRVVELWQSGEEFERRGGKRERGLLMLGAPGTGKTMMSKAIATGFNCPFVSIPGSGFAGMFLGMDAITVRLLARRARRLAAKWGGQCIVFIDEIDAVGMRRSSLGAFTSPEVSSVHDVCFYGPNGALTPTEDVIARDARVARPAVRGSRTGTALRRPDPAGQPDRQPDLPGGMFGGGQLALNQLLVVMDGIGSPPLDEEDVRRTGSTRSWTRCSSCRAGSAACRFGCRTRSRPASRSTSSGPATHRSSRSTRR